MRLVRGTRDLFDKEVNNFQMIEFTAHEIFKSHGYHEIRTPILEDISLFQKSVGEDTDIYQKEMYRLSHNDKICLRPEGTASTVRSYISNMTHLPKPQRLFYIGPMFRRESPQKGRYRQFNQIGCELFGSSNPISDIESISMAKSFLDSLNLSGGYELRLNSVGCDSCRPSYEKALKEYLTDCDLCDNCIKRIETNSLRVLDCKKDQCCEVVNSSPNILDYLCSDCDDHFSIIRNWFGEDVIDHRLVRGLDYYTRTVFEFKTTELGSQDAILAGGRYDNLVKSLGGQLTPSIGWAAGEDRLSLLMLPLEEENDLIYVISLGSNSSLEAINISNQLRSFGKNVMVDVIGGSMKNQIKRAVKNGSNGVVIIGDTELAKGVISYKDLSTRVQSEIKLEDISNVFNTPS